MSVSGQSQKTKTGIKGLDEITYGGLPAGRCTVISGGAGSGKTFMSMEFLVRGARDFGEPGVYVSFTEREEDVRRDFSTVNFDLEELENEGKLILNYAVLELQDVVMIKGFQLDEFLPILEKLVDKIGARRVVLDSLEVLFAGLRSTTTLRLEICRLFDWVKDKGLTTVVTCERGNDTLTNYQVEEYLSDCVILLNHRIDNLISTRHLQVVKYRGSKHETNEFPYMLDNDGVTILPITVATLDYPVSGDRVPTGLTDLDSMLDGQGYYAGTSVLASGTAGTGKTTMAAQFASAACKRGKKTLYFAFEEAREQIIRNQRSVGIDLQQWLDQGILKMYASRPSMFGLEAHLSIIQKNILEFEPEVVVIDPITNFVSVGTYTTSKAMLVRMVDFFKQRQITAFFTSLIPGNDALNESEAGISSLIDTWILLRDQEFVHRRDRTLTILKSRGMPHETGSRRLVFTDNGISLEPMQSED